MLQNEYRQKKKFYFIADVGLTKGYKSSIRSNRNSIESYFTKFDMDLNLNEFSRSNVNFFVEKVITIL